MLSFSGQLDKILDGTKTMTTRLDAKGWYINNLTKGTALHIWWRNPRNQQPDCYRIGVAVCQWIVRKEGRDFTEAQANRDGFGTLWDYKVALANHHNMTVEQVNEWTWTQIRWGDHHDHNPVWIDGPHPRKVA